MFSSAVQAPSQLNSDVWERHTVPGARHLQEELAFLKCHSLLGRNIKSGKSPYIAGLWKRCLARTSPNAWVDITLRKYILRVVQMWVGQIMEFFLLLLQANPIFSYFLSPEYFNLVFRLKKKSIFNKKVSWQLASYFYPEWRDYSEKEHTGENSRVMYNHRMGTFCLNIKQFRWMISLIFTLALGVKKSQAKPNQNDGWNYLKAFFFFFLISHVRAGSCQQTICKSKEDFSCDFLHQVFVSTSLID